MRFVRTSQDANTHNKDACCGDFYGTSSSDVPENEKAGGTVYCYTQCGNCGAIWRDGFKNAHHTEHVYDGYATHDGYGDHPFEWEEFDFEYSHIDTNKLHDGRAIVVYTPTNNPLDTWEEEDYYIHGDKTIQDYRDKYDMDDFRKKKTYVFRFCEVAQDTVAPLPVEAIVSYQPPNKVELAGRVTELTFNEEHEVESIDLRLVESAGQYDADEIVTVDAELFSEHGTIREDPWDNVIHRRPSL